MSVDNERLHVPKRYCRTCGQALDVVVHVSKHYNTWTGNRECCVEYRCGSRAKKHSNWFISRWPDLMHSIPVYVDIDSIDIDDGIEVSTVEDKK